MPFYVGDEMVDHVKFTRGYGMVCYTVCKVNLSK